MRAFHILVPGVIAATILLGSTQGLTAANPLEAAKATAASMAESFRQFAKKVRKEPKQPAPVKTEAEPIATPASARVIKPAIRRTAAPKAAASTPAPKPTPLPVAQLSRPRTADASPRDSVASFLVPPRISSATPRPDTKSLVYTAGTVIRLVDDNNCVPGVGDCDPGVRQNHRSGIIGEFLYIQARTMDIPYATPVDGVGINAVPVGMTLMANDPFFAEEMAEQNNITLATKDEIFAEADYITLHAPLLKETHHMINDETLAKCKDGVRIVNCARGELIDDAALLRGIESGKVAGAAIDVYHEEPPAADHPLIGRDEVVCTPHLAASTAEAQEKVARQIMASVVDGILEKPVQGAINMPSVDPTIFEAIQPYLLLGERIGSFVSQISDGSLKKMTIEDYKMLADCEDAKDVLKVLDAIEQKDKDNGSTK